MKLLLGGSPCTHWSIAQTKNRETEPSGIGWELFKNYKIALEKFQPDYFLYENNKSMSADIREQITKELGVEPICINSALVSAQNRLRLYWTNIPGVEQPEDRGILLRDILETGEVWREKAYTLKANYRKTSYASYFDGGHFPAAGAAEPVNVTKDGKSQTVKAQYGKNSIANFCGYTSTYGATGVAVRVGGASADGKTCPVYDVKDGLITIKDKQYPIKLRDGCYIIRKLTVTECKRLQTVPETYVFPVSDTQAYKMLGNGWTVDVIAHILSFASGITTEPLEVLSMYDGMSCGHIALDKLGARVVKYYATEIDKYAIQTTQTNYPGTVQLGDAFQVRDEIWRIPAARDEAVAV